MLSFTTAELNALLVSWLFPLVRVLGMVAIAPVFQSQGFPLRARVLTGLAITVALVPALPPVSNLDPGSGAGIFVLVQQILIGVAIGFVMRLVFAAVDVAGEVIGFQMSLSFATAFDPQNGGQSAVIQEFLGLMATLTFLALDGHLMLIAALAQSFKILPIAVGTLNGDAWVELTRAGAYIFSAGVMLSLPLIAALLVTSIALGVLTRAAPQLNLFAVGFPITLSVGFTMLALTLQYIAPNFERMFGHGMDTIDLIMRAMGG